MVVLITGATGFIGGQLARALHARGLRVVGTARRVPSEPVDVTGVDRWITADYANDLTADDWRPRLAGVDVVVNAVGILRESSGARFATLHTQAPIALFEACERGEVRRVVQISALGADAGARSAYHRSKRAADERLAASALDWVIVQPSLVYGPGGESARLFDRLASLPVIVVPGDGQQQVQPIHIDDAVEAIAALVAPGACVRRRIALVGPQALSLREFLQQLRGALGLARAPVIGVPMTAVRFVARAGEHLPGALLDRETLGMLLRGNVAPAHDTQSLLGRSPRPASRFVATRWAPAARTHALVGALAPVLRLAMALVWIVTGIVSLGVYPVSDSLALLARVGVHGPPALAMLYGAASLDLALGVATLAMRRRRALWRVQAALILGYTALITWRLPEYWLHPYGPILKNLPMLAVLWLLDALEAPSPRGSR